jgi:Ni,Fe-hydrogenase III component G
MPSIEDILAQGARIEVHRPWPRAVVSAQAWRELTAELAAGQATLLGLWGEAGGAPAVHMAILARDTGAIAVASYLCLDLSFPSVGALHPPAIRLERAMHSLYGLVPVGAPDTRPWLDLGFWDVQFPLGRTSPHVPSDAAYDFLPAQGEGLHQIPVGPVHAGIIEPGHFRFTASGETVVRRGAARLCAQGHRVAAPKCAACRRRAVGGPGLGR